MKFLILTEKGTDMLIEQGIASVLVKRKIMKCDDLVIDAKLLFFLNINK